MGQSREEVNEAVAKKMGSEVQCACHVSMGEDLHWPHYSTDIRAAWWVVEFLGPKFNNIALNWDDGGFYCTLDGGQLNVGNKWPHVTETADSAPMAICKAFLRLKESKP